MLEVNNKPQDKNSPQQISECFSHPMWLPSKRGTKLLSNIILIIKQIWGTGNHNITHTKDAFV